MLGIALGRTQAQHPVVQFNGVLQALVAAVDFPAIRALGMTTQLFLNGAAFRVRQTDAVIVRQPANVGFGRLQRLQTVLARQVAIDIVPRKLGRHQRRFLEENGSLLYGSSGVQPSSLEESELVIPKLFTANPSFTFRDVVRTSTRDIFSSDFSR